MLKINLPFISVFLILLSLPLANISMLFGLENQGILIILPLFLLLSLIYIFKNKRIYINKIVVTIIVIFMLPSIFLFFYIEKVENFNLLVINNYINISIKGFIFLMLYLYIKRLTLCQIEKLFKYFIFTVFFTSIIAFVIYKIGIHKYRFIFYGDRFGAFFFELTYYSYALFIAYFFYSYKYSSKIKKILFFSFIVCFTLIFTKSSIIPLIITFSFFYFISKKIKINYSVIFIFVIIFGFFILMYLKDFISYLEYISFIFPRFGSINLDGHIDNPVLVRIVQMIASLKYFIGHLYYPPIGYNSAILSYEYIDEFLHKKTAAGVYSFMADFGLLSFLIMFILFRKLYLFFSTNTDYNIHLMMISSLLVIAFEAGYLNFGVLTIIILLFRINYLIRYNYVNFQYR